MVLLRVRGDRKWLEEGTKVATAAQHLPAADGQNPLVLSSGLSAATTFFRQSENLENGFAESMYDLLTETSERLSRISQGHTAIRQRFLFPILKYLGLAVGNS